MPGGSPSGDATTGAGPDAGAAGSGASGSTTSADRRAAIYRRIDDTLGTFDGRIRAEQAAILADRDAHGGDRAGSGPDGGDSKNGVGTGADGKESGKDQGKNKGASGNGRDGTANDGARPGGAKSDDAGGMRSDKVGAARATVVGGGGAAPADVPDGHDDDIVARQIREAAIAETDPELKDKLWDEYRKYKRGK